MSLKDLERYNHRGTGRTTALLNAAIDLAKLFPNPVLYVVQTVSEANNLRRSVKDMPRNLKIINVEQEGMVHGLPMTTSVIIDPQVLEVRIAELEESNKKLRKVIKSMIDGV